MLSLEPAYKTVLALIDVRVNDRVEPVFIIDELALAKKELVVIFVWIIFGIVAVVLVKLFVDI